MLENLRFSKLRFSKLRFAEFSKTSIFSGLNNITDITVNHSYATICGYSQTELENCFADYIDDFINAKDISRESFLSLIKKVV